MVRSLEDVMKDRNFQSLERTGPAVFLPEPEPEDLFCPILSVDDHVLEPMTLFDGRVPSGLKEDVPQALFVDGAPYWVIDGVQLPAMRVGDGSVGRPLEGRTGAPQRPD